MDAPLFSLQLVAWFTFIGIDGYLLWNLFKSPFIYRKMLAEAAYVEQLKVEFKERVPSGWVFWDGTGI